TAFYQHLAAVSAWENMTVTAAAQAVQHSAAPDAYAQWESEARALAEALTGEAPAGLACRYPTQGSSGSMAGLDQALTLEVGPPAAGSAVSPSRGWTVAGWLVGHAHQYRIAFVAFAGQRWTPAKGAWVADAGSTATVQVGTRQ
ncbi:MAG: hypothetical protein ACR2KC_03250, partial [Acidimicrobiales bacterium]